MANLTGDFLIDAQGLVHQAAVIYIWEVMEPDGTLTSKEVMQTTSGKRMFTAYLHNLSAMQRLVDAFDAEPEVVKKKVNDSNIKRRKFDLES